MLSFNQIVLLHQGCFSIKTLVKNMEVLIMSSTCCRPHGDPQMMRFGAHLVLVLRYLLADQMKDDFKEKIMAVGDLILHM